MTPAPRAKLKIDVLVDSDLWQEPAKTRSLVRRAVAQAAATASTTGTELAIVLTDDSAIRQLNRLWRGIDTATNVLSFPSKKTANEPPHLGDIVLAYETIARCMVFCTSSAAIMTKTPMRKPWSKPSVRSCGASTSRILTGIRARS